MAAPRKASAAKKAAAPARSRASSRTPAARGRAAAKSTRKTAPLQAVDPINPVPGAAVAGPAPSPRDSGYRQRSYYLHDDVARRLRDTWWGTHQQPECPLTMSDFVSTAVALLCDLLEAEHNDGEPYPPSPAKLPSGPSVLSAARRADAMRDAWARRGQPS